MTPSGVLIWAASNLDGASSFTSLYGIGCLFQYGNNTVITSAQYTAAAYGSSMSVAVSGTSWSSTPCPSGWRLPTSAEINYLISDTYTSRKWTTGSGSGTGLEVITKTVGSIRTSQFLYFQNTGVRVYADKRGYDYGTHGYYWASNAPDSSNAQDLTFGNSSGTTVTSNAGQLNTHLKTYAFAIRCVRDCYRGYVN